MGQGGLRAYSIIPGMAHGVPDVAAAFQLGRDGRGEYLHRDLDWNRELVMPDAARSQAFTVETIVRPSSTSGIVWDNRGDTDVFYWALSAAVGTNRLTGTVSDGTNSQYHILYDSVYAGEWIHAVFCYDDIGQTNLFGNGQPAGGTWEALSPRAGDGLNHALTQRGQDCMYLRHWNRALSDSEMLRLYEEPYAFMRAPIRRKTIWVAQGWPAVEAVSGTDKEFAGTLTAASSHSSELFVERPLAGTLTAATSFAGVWLIGADREFAGTSTTASNHSSELSVDRTFAGTSTTASNHSSELSVDRTFAGTSTAASSHASELSVERPLAGTSTTASSHSSELFVERPLAGTLTAATAFAGVWEKEAAGVKEFSGTSTTASNHSSELSVDRTFVGASTTASNHSSAFSVDRNIDGTLTSTTAFVGEIYIVGTEQEFSGTCTAASNHSSELSVERIFAGLLTASELLVAELSVDRPLVGALSAVTSFAGILSVDLSFQQGDWDTYALVDNGPETYSYVNAGDTWT